MNYRHVLVVIGLNHDACAVLGAVRRYVPSAQRIAVVVHAPVVGIGTDGDLEARDAAAPARPTLDAVREAAQALGPQVDIVASVELSVTPLAAATSTGSIELVVAGALGLAGIACMALLRRRVALPILFVGADLRPADAAPRLLCLAATSRARRSLARFLRERASAHDEAVLIGVPPAAADELTTVRDTLGIAAELRTPDGDERLPWRLFGTLAEPTSDVVVTTRMPPLPVLSAHRRPSLLVLPPTAKANPEAMRAIDAPDLVDDGAGIRARIEYREGLAVRTPVEDQEIGVVHEGRIVARARTRSGGLELDAGLESPIGLFRTACERGQGPYAEAIVEVIRPGAMPIVLFDADGDPRTWAPLRTLPWARPLAVRLHAENGWARLRAKLRDAELSPRVIDASAVLDEGPAIDVPGQAADVRLARVAARLRHAGFDIAAIVHRGTRAPDAWGFAVIAEHDVGTRLAPKPPTPPSARYAVLSPDPSSVPETPSPAHGAHVTRTLDRRLDDTIPAAAIAGNRIELELDNRAARESLLAAIRASRHRVHFQVYMAADDDVGRQVGAALSEAAARGVQVRVLVDSLHGWHGSFGAHNPLLDRLAAQPGVSLRVGRPLAGAPSVEALKQRDHRKLAVIDGEVALLGGRNLSHEYYTGFDEVALRPEMTWRTVPWLEAGATVHGPIVGTLDRLFVDAWTEAGGEPVEVATPARVGTVTARVIAHRGLRDAYTLEAYLALIDDARTHVLVVNGFPLLLELQHALLRALRRGVHVRTVFGNLTPRHARGTFSGPWAQARAAATSFVHSRMDPLIDAGAECYEFVVPRPDGWDATLGDVRPHVHAKAMSIDARVCTVGSANFDVTATYWENEVVLLVEDPSVARAFESRVDEWLRASTPVDPRSDDWRRRAEQRRWMRYWPGMLSV